MTRTFPGAVETIDDFPEFCATCGRALIVEDRTDHFDRATGAPVLVAYAYCRGSWLDRLLSDVSEFHDSYVVSPRPSPSALPRNGAT